MWKKALYGIAGGLIIYNIYDSKVVLPPAATMSFEDYVLSKGYFYQTHWVTTSDGYILRMYRISKDPNFSAAKSPVLMVHGLTHSAITFVIAQNSSPPAFTLADNNYDIWLLNTRGNYLSRLHTSLNPSEKSYWKWCSNHIGNYDLPASIDYILKNTHREKINYVGHSQGAGVALHCLAYHPEYNSKINVAALLAPPGGILSMQAKYLHDLIDENFIESLDKKGVNFIADYSNEPNDLAKKALVTPKFAAKQYKDRYDTSLYNENPEVLCIYFQKFAGGTSLMNLKYAAQIVKKNSERPFAFDYGEDENLKVYGTKEPPMIDYQKIKAKLAVFFGKYDTIVTPSNGETLVKNLPSEQVIYKQFDCEVDHSGFAVSPNMKHMDKIVEIFNENEPKN